jgi:hypothetical protein
VSITLDRSTLSRLQREIAELRLKEAVEVRKQAELTTKANKAASSASRASSASMLQSYIRETETHSRDLEASHKRHAGISTQIAMKTKQAGQLQDRISRAEESERKTAQKAEEKRQKEHNRQMREMELRIASLGREAEPLRTAPIAPGEAEAHDVFICHASEDKEDFVDALAAKAGEAGLDVWYDSFKLKWGDSLRQKIDLGLAGSYFGVVVLSGNFFAKQWTQYELDGLVQKEFAGQGRILPIWHKVTHDEVRKASPSLAGRLALNTMTHSTDDIVSKLVEMRDQLKPRVGGP